MSYLIEVQYLCYRSNTFQKTEFLFDNFSVKAIARAAAVVWYDYTLISVYVPEVMLPVIQVPREQWEEEANIAISETHVCM